MRHVMCIGLILLCISVAGKNHGCHEAMREKGWRPLSWGQNHGRRTLWPWGNNPESPMTGKFLPGAETAAESWQLKELLACFVRCLSVWMGLAWGGDII